MSFHNQNAVSKIQVCLGTVAFLGLILNWPLNVVIADDWSQWLGNNRDSVWTETGIVDELPAKPTVLWRTPIKSGYAGPAVVGNRVFVSDYDLEEGEMIPDPGKRNVLKGKERVLCLNATDGKILWKYEYDCPYSISYGYGPRATPTVNEGHVYVLGAEGHLACLNAEDGVPVWKKELKKEYKLAEAPIWGFAAHPLVDGDTLYCLVGGKGSVAVAFDKKTGEEKWRALSAKDQGYCPPTMIEAGGVKQLLIWHAKSLNSLDPETGKVHWSFPMKPAYEMSIIAPIKHGDFLLTTALQGESLLLKLDSEKPAAKEVWRGKGIFPDHNPPIIVDNHIYGVDVKGHFRCIELVSGDRQWESLETVKDGRPKSSATGFVVRNGEKYFVINEDGELILVDKLTPDGMSIKGRIQLLEPTSSSFGRKVVWSHPAFARKCVFARNDKEIVCVSLAK